MSIAGLFSEREEKEVKEVAGKAEVEGKLTPSFTVRPSAVDASCIIGETEPILSGGCLAVRLEADRHG